MRMCSAYNCKFSVIITKKFSLNTSMQDCYSRWKSMEYSVLRTTFRVPRALVLKSAVCYQLINQMVPFRVLLFYLNVTCSRDKK
jgi:hypothetical protein